MAKKIEDTYTVRQAALALGVTVKRIRQMLIEGKLTRYGNQPVTIRQIEVLELREKETSTEKQAHRFRRWIRAPRWSSNYPNY